MTQLEQDVAYLGEYIQFSSKNPVVVGTHLHGALQAAHHNKDFETVAHLQVRLHSEMVLCLETMGALLRAYSLWDEPGGILGAMLSYRPRDVRKFIESLSKSNNPLKDLRFPEKRDVLAHCPDAELVEQGYTDQEVTNLVTNTCRMYLSEVVRGAYNKTKHGGLLVRHPDLLQPTPGKLIINEDVFVLLGQTNDRLDFTSFRVVGEEGIKMADGYLNNIRIIVDRSCRLATFVMFFADKRLLAPKE